MKKKIEPEVPPQRIRRSNSELLPMPREALRRIKDVAEQSCMPVSQVYADVLRLGLLAVKPMYEPMINFRAEAERRWQDENREPVPETGDGLVGKIAGPGSADIDVRDRQNGEESLPPVESGITDEQFESAHGLHDAPVGPGLEPEIEANLRMADSQ